MERLKYLIPDELKRVIGRSAPENLTMTSSLLLDLFLPLPQFQQVILVIRELTDPDLALCRKSKEAALDSKQKGNERFMKGDYVEALSFYSHALRHAPASSSEMDVNLVAALYVNRASSMHVTYCSRLYRAVSIIPVLYRTGILLKSCWETHCHFCFDELPADILFCPSCIIPVYCSKNCQEQALGKHDMYLNKKILATDLEKHVMNAILANPTRNTGEDICSNHIPEHRHECGGSHWSSVLPPDIVLAARVIVTSIEKCKASGRISNPLDYLVNVYINDFVHNYAQNPSVSKLESHVYAIVLLYCLHQYYNSDFPLSGASVAQVP
ncbi:hypothetical protein BHE74_00038430 [Ensete ventricosum]|nr:hypothetical protein BHE74_00038430 [Ensete ventricosum]